MARMYTNAERTRINYGDISQLTNWILGSGATCHITPDISHFYWACWRKQINISKLQMSIFSQQNMQDKFK